MNERLEVVKDLVIQVLALDEQEREKFIELVEQTHCIKCLKSHLYCYCPDYDDSRLEND